MLKNSSIDEHWKLTEKSNSLSVKTWESFPSLYKYSNSDDPNQKYQHKCPCIFLFVNNRWRKKGNAHPNDLKSKSKQ